MSNFVLVVDDNKKPCDPVRPGYARVLLKLKKASVYRRYPFTLILRKVKTTPCMGYDLKLDPGSKTTGIAIVREDGVVVFGAELTHRGQAIKCAMQARKIFRRARRNRTTRYRAKRFLNRARKKERLPPSLMHQILTTITWVERLIKYAPITRLVQELAKFDAHKIQNPSVSGVSYRTGTLHGRSAKEYLIHKWGGKCAYCGATSALEIDHVLAKSKGGSDRISNLVLACRSCNLKKGNTPIAQFLSKHSKLLQSIRAHQKTPLRDSAVVNSTRMALSSALRKYNLPISTGSGAQTKINRDSQNIDKAHWRDAAAVGEISQLYFATTQPLLISAKGRGNKRLCRGDKHGFPCAGPRKTYSHNWVTGDTIGSVKDGVRYVGRCVVQSEKRLELRVGGKRIGGSLGMFKKLFSADGYTYSFTKS